MYNFVIKCIKRDHSISNASHTAFFVYLCKVNFPSFCAVVCSLGTTASNNVFGKKDDGTIVQYFFEQLRHFCDGDDMMSFINRGVLTNKERKFTHNSARH